MIYQICHLYVLTIFLLISTHIMYIIRATSWQRHVIFYHTITVFLISRHWSPGNSQIEILVSQRAFALWHSLSTKQHVCWLGSWLFQIIQPFGLHYPNCNISQIQCLPSRNKSPPGKHWRPFPLVHTEESCQTLGLWHIDIAVSQYVSSMSMWWCLI